MTHYLAEKLEDNVLSKKTAAAWAKREGVKFYRVNEKFSSIQYLVQSKHLSTQITRKEYSRLLGWQKNYRSEHRGASDPSTRDEWS